MAHWVARKTAKTQSKWRTVLCAVLVFLAAVAVLASIVVRYIDANVLDTDRYVDITSSLAEDPAVATALGAFTADRLFNGGAVENQVAEFLPSKLSPAAPLVTNALKDEVATVATGIASSNAFQSTWTATNRAAHTALLEVAHSERRETSHNAELTLKLQGLFDTVRQRFGGDDGTLLNPDQKASATELAISLRQSVQQVRDYVGLVETGAWLLPLLSIVLLVGAIFVANSRRLAILAIGSVFTVLGLTALLAFCLAARHVFGSFEQEVYKNAAQVIFDAFYGNLRIRLVGLTVTGVLLVAAALLASRYTWAVRVRQWLHLPR